MKYSIIPITCLLLAPLVTIIIPVTPVTVANPGEYALNFAGPPIGWNGHDRLNDITYFSFYTFFKSGINPDCIDMVNESKGLRDNVQV